MKRLFTRPRLAMAFGVLGVVLMGVDLMMTRNFFTHIGEIMIASLLCFVAAIVIDRDASKQKKAGPGGAPGR